MVSLGLILAGASLSVPARAQESNGYTMSRVTLSATGAVASSATFESRVTFGQAVPVGAASRCNDGYHQTAGFWSLLGDQPVPTLLFVTRDVLNPAGVILAWTGSADQFGIYRATAPNTILDASHLTQTVFGCTATDAPPLAPATYYSVVPTTP